MAIDHRLNAIHDTQRQLEEMQAELRRFQQGGSGGDGGGMDQIDRRVGRLEGQFDTMSDHMIDVKASLATLTERTAHLPSKGFIIKALATSVGLLSTLVAIVSGLVVIAFRLGWI